MPDTLSPEVEALVLKIKEAITTSGVPLADAQRALSSVSGDVPRGTLSVKLVETAPVLNQVQLSETLPLSEVAA